jgi:uncharacterized protein
MINTVCFFELPADEFEPLQDFYNKLFDWTFEKVPGGFRYYKIHMGQDTPKGGMTARQDPTHTPVNYVKVEAIEESLMKAERLGAKIVVPKKSVPGAGWFAVLLDPQGNRLGLWEEDPDAG